ncbi:hypothetical protein GCM10022291_33100 [Postechiella marina]|uniref:HMA domain-containing protein n=1 Tax=Postechiella marina TaxID=943941 RepID=A0ABP8CHA6_9FLAO
MITVKYKTNLHCNSCIKTITPALNKMDNVDFWKVDLNHQNKILEVNLDDDNKTDIIPTIEGLGFKIEEL